MEKSKSSCHCCTHSQRFVVCRSEPILVLPSQPTPHLVLLLPSDCHSTPELSHCFRSHVHVLKPDKWPKSPPKALRGALSDMLVAYYPFAGRLIANKQDRLEVWCKGQGGVFVEAHGNSTLAELRKLQRSQYLRQLYQGHDIPKKHFGDVPSFSAQVTELRCGTLILAVRVCEMLCDAQRLLHFVNEWEDIARTPRTVSIPPPIWGEPAKIVRTARPPDIQVDGTAPLTLKAIEKASHEGNYYMKGGVVSKLTEHEESVQETEEHTKHDEREVKERIEDISVTSVSLMQKQEVVAEKYFQMIPESHVREESKIVEESVSISQQQHMEELQVGVHKSMIVVDITVEGLLGLKKQVMKDGVQKCTTFEVLAAHVWKERTRALKMPHMHEVKLLFLSDDCNRKTETMKEVYGEHAFNCLAIARAGELVERQLSYGVRLIQEAKGGLEMGFGRCVAELKDVVRKKESGDIGVVLLTEIVKMKACATMEELMMEVRGGKGKGWELIGGANIIGVARRCMDYDSMFVLLSKMPLLYAEEEEELRSRIRATAHRTQS